MKKDKIFRPDLEHEVEMCSICGRDVGMVYDDRDLKNPYPFMCWVCELRFPPEQWEADEQGLFFNLTKNGTITLDGNKIFPSLSNSDAKPKQTDK